MSHSKSMSHSKLGTITFSVISEMSQEHKISGQMICIAFPSTAFHNRTSKSLYHQRTRRTPLQSPILSPDENRRVGLVHLWRNSTASQSGWNYFLSMDFISRSAPSASLSGESHEIKSEAELVSVPSKSQWMNSTLWEGLERLSWGNGCITWEK